MQYEMKSQYTVPVSGFDLDAPTNLKPSAVLSIIQRGVEQHLLSLKFDVASMESYGIAWVLLSATTITNPFPAGCSQLTMKTWHSDTKGPIFRRELEFFDDNNCPVIIASTFSVLLDVKTRRMVRPSKLPIIIPEPNRYFVIPDANSRLSVSGDLCFFEKRKVRNSHIDILGHVNNCRYADYAYDTLNDVEQKHHIYRMQIDFNSELHKGEIFDLYKKSDEDGNVFISGKSVDREKCIFNVHFKTTK